MRDKKPVLVIFIGIIDIIVGLGLFIVAVFFVTMGAILCAGAGSVIVGVMSIVNGSKYLGAGILFMTIGTGLLYFKRWARYAMVSALIAIIYGLTYYQFHNQFYFLYVIICIACLLYLFQHQIAAEFKKKD